MKECGKSGGNHMKERRRKKFFITPYKPQIYFYVFWQVLSILSPLDVMLAAVGNVLLEGLFN